MKIYNPIIILFIIIGFFYILNNFLPQYENFNNINKNKEPYILPKKIFMYWNNLSNNKIIQANIELCKRKIPNDWEINVIDNNNLNQYVSREFINKYSWLDPTRFSDFLRLELLKNYGGVWMDAGIIVINGTFLNTFYNEMIELRYDACLYELKSRTIDPNIPYLENWFIMSKKNGELINDLYTEFNKSFEMDFLKYKLNVLIPSGVILEKTIGYDDKRTYLMQHAIINYLFHQGHKYNINIKDAQDSMFKIQIYKKWNNNKIIEYILNNNNWNNFYAIKLTHINRKGIKDEEKYIKKINSL